MGVTTEVRASPESTTLQRLVATDFYGYYRPSECGLRVWLRHQGVEKAPPGTFAQSLMRLGREHEERHLETFPGHLDLGRLPITKRLDRTREAIDAEEAVIYQGAFRGEVTLANTPTELIGVPDFILRTGKGYAIRDSKLARRVGEGAHVEIELQLQAYGWLYEQTFGAPPASLQVHNGANEILEVPYEGGEEALAILERILSIRLAPSPPQTTVGWSKCSSCEFFEHCWPPAVERHSIGLLPWVDRGLIGELEAAGVETLDQLLERFDEESLAELERPWGAKRMKVGPAASRILTNARALLENRPIVLQPPAIPDSSNYVMFDLEGLPPQLDELEKIYLWGLQVCGEQSGPFRPATSGFGPRGDEEGWEAFLREADAIFAEHGDIPFVHWASYERTKIDLYINRYGDPDGTAERVKRNLLDLLPITYEAVALPLSSYGLKAVEQLVGFERQLTEYGGDWSMARYIEAAETEDKKRRTEIIGEILDYNREDLEATWAVLSWLRKLNQADAPSL